MPVDTFKWGRESPEAFQVRVCGVRWTVRDAGKQKLDVGLCVVPELDDVAGLTDRNDAHLLGYQHIREIVASASSQLVMKKAVAVGMCDGPLPPSHV
ncbi:hypothetical protein DLM46_34860 [Paraburkholderia lacunae]|uniref:Uncharacterized protein n=1 Tax=Paraburkholderia lacunae TaxID=2211104 RepID=A0A370MXJ7_9BURK|nr:hypothetical protein DLM46_34860 [Paraburkholderia lacunae]